MLFDTHVHMNDPAFDADRDELIRSFPDHGVHLAMNVGCSLASSHDAIALAETYPGLVLGGRLGEFRYYNMDAAAASAMRLCREHQ